MAGLQCPSCGNGASRIVESRPFADGIRRRRECARCGNLFTTYECGNDMMRRLMDLGFKTGYREGKEKAENEHANGI